MVRGIAGVGGEVTGSLTSRPAPESGGPRTKMVARVEQPVDLVIALVDDVLNARNVGALDQIMSPRFLDHHPLFSGNPAAGQRRRGGIDDFRSLVRWIASDDVDLTFHLEDAFATDLRIAYRIFGAGTICGGGGAGPVRNVTYEAVGIFRASPEPRLAERWGPVVVEVS
jgi:hypothetical protein